MTDVSSKQNKPDPCSFVIFGATGDLTHRLVIPALYNLAATDLLPDKFCVVGVARKGTSNDDLRDSLMKGLRQYATRPVDDNATVAFRGNRYSVPPGLSGVTLELRHRLASATLEIHASSGTQLATHRLAPAGAGTIVRTPEHRAALESVILSSFTVARPCDTKANRPPGPESLAEAARLLGAEGREVTVDLQDYADLIEGTA